MSSTEGRDHYLAEIISYIGDQVTSKTESWQQYCRLILFSQFC